MLDLAQKTLLDLSLVWLWHCCCVIEHFGGVVQGVVCQLPEWAFFGVFCSVLCTVSSRVSSAIHAARGAIWGLCWYDSWTVRSPTIRFLNSFHARCFTLGKKNMHSMVCLISPSSSPTRLAFIFFYPEKHKINIVPSMKILSTIKAVAVQSRPWSQGRSPSVTCGTARGSRTSSEMSRVASTEASKLA